jgi:hypothetical protein
MDWPSRYVLAWRLSNMMARFILCSTPSTWLDNVFVERLWRSLK